MSAIASFIKLPKTDLNGLREAAVLKQRLLRAPSDTFHDYLQRNGNSVADYNWSGYVMATLLVYLQNERQIDLTHSDCGELSTFLTKSRGATHFIFTNAHKEAFLTKLGGEFSEEALRDYYNEFNGSADSEVGKPMLDGIQALRECLETLDDNSIILFGIE
jgi:hypothetical protein